jgi:formylglycine-generating enzyme required for sulfatase activity
MNVLCDHRVIGCHGVGGRLIQLVLGLAALLMLTSGPSLAGTVPESERWATITHAGNAPYPTQPPPFSQYPYPPGRVDYEYQISRTETTGAEWLEFVQAYAPYVDPALAGTSGFTSQRIRATETSPGVWQYELRSGGANRAIRVGWRFAARYVNWLHNGKGTEQAAFESGVYESSTFGGSPSEGGFTDQVSRSEGARYFLPTIDEWVKAAYYDPERYPPEIGGPGYWLYPNSSDTELIPGPPGVGQTSAGSMSTPEVASYTNVQSPWGLWDLSGGQAEWLETAALNPNGTVSTRFQKGTRELSPLLNQDHIDYLGADFPSGGLVGFRLARVIPSPGAALVFLACSASVVLKRRRRYA